MSPLSHDAVGIAGSGRVAQALGRLLQQRGNQTLVVAGRDRERCRHAAAFVGGNTRAVSYSQLPQLASRIVVAVPDSAIASVADELAKAGMRSGVALHTCGSQGARALDSLTAQGVSCGVLHPLQTIASPEQGVQALVGAVYGVSGDDAALAWAREIVSLLEGEVLVVPDERRAVYHAAAVMASNYVVALIDAAEILMGRLGLPPGVAARAVAPLVRSSVENALSVGPVEALTGPIERGDAGTVERHLKALAGAPESIHSFYRAGAAHALTIARRGGLDAALATEIEKTLSAKRQ